MAKLLPPEASSPETALAEVSERAPRRGAGVRGLVKSVIWAIQINQAVKGAAPARRHAVMRTWLNQAPF